MKKLLLAIPDYMIEEILELQPFVASTITGTIIQMLDHGINYELKKKKKYLEKRKQQPQESAQEVTADQQNDKYTEEEKQAILEIASVKWAK